MTYQSLYFRIFGIPVDKTLFIYLVVGYVVCVFVLLGLQPVVLGLTSDFELTNLSYAAQGIISDFRDQP